MRGEYQFFQLRALFFKGSPPLARGILAFLFPLSYTIRITPACAGNTICFAVNCVEQEDHPRLRGEYFLFRFRLCHTQGSPPLARGIQGFFLCGNISARITPACAGNTATCVGKAGAYQDHPRLRGEYKAFFFAEIFLRGSPPLARGILFPIPYSITTNRITPACAGNTALFSAFSVKT